MLGIDVQTFDYLLNVGFQQLWDKNAPVHQDGKSRQERRSLDAIEGLGLVLYFLTSIIRENALQHIFALTPSRCHRYINFALAVLNQTLRKIPETEICWPNNATFQSYSDMIEAKHGPILKGGFGSVDVLNLPVQASSDEEMQDAMYNVWLRAHLVGNVLAFAPTGEIVYMLVNCPGSWHAAKITESLYTRLLTQTPQGFFLLADTAFPRNEVLENRIKIPLKARVHLPADSQMREALLEESREITTARQVAEWGIRSIQASFGRLRIPLPSDPKTRSRILTSCFYLHQLRVRRIGMDQIQSVYDPLWQDSTGS